MSHFSVFLQKINPRTHQKVTTNLFFVMFILILMIFIRTIPVRSLCITIINGFADIADPLLKEFLSLSIQFFSFSINLIIVLLLMHFFFPGSLKLFIAGGWKRCIKTFLIGLGIGAGLNAIICILAGVSASLVISFNILSSYLLLILPFVILQCSTEEVMFRGYGGYSLEKRYGIETAAFLGSILFVFAHSMNLITFGFDLMFCINVFLIGILLYLLMKLFGSIWICFGFHTGWNFMQMFLIGVPNSGYPGPAFSLFSGTEPVNSFFWNTAYGCEGTWICMILLLVCIIAGQLIYLCLKKHGKSFSAPFYSEQESQN